MLIQASLQKDKANLQTSLDENQRKLQAEVQTVKQELAVKSSALVKREIELANAGEKLLSATSSNIALETSLQNLRNEGKVGDDHIA